MSKQGNSEPEAREPAVESTHTTQHVSHNQASARAPTCLGARQSGPCLTILRRAAFVRVPRARDSRLAPASHLTIPDSLWTAVLDVARLDHHLDVLDLPARPPPRTPPTPGMLPGHCSLSDSAHTRARTHRARVLAHEDSPHTPSSTDPPCRQSEAKAVDDTGRVPSMRVSHTSQRERRWMHARGTSDYH